MNNNSTKKTEITIESEPLDRKALLTFIICTLIGVVVFFVPMEVMGSERNILFGTIVSGLVKVLGTLWLWIVSVMIIGNALGFVTYAVLNVKNQALINYYKSDSNIQGALYVIGAIYAFLYLFKIGPDWIIGGATGGTVIGAIALPVGWIVPLGGLFVALFAAFGALEFVGALLEPIMRPLFKLPGRAALNAVTSFVGASSIGAYLTSVIYKDKLYTEKEVVQVATSFSVVSVGFAALCADAVGLLPMFPTVFFSAFVVTFIVAIIMVRIPPISKKTDNYIDGTVQTEKERTEEAKFGAGVFKKGLQNAVKKASEADSVPKELWNGFVAGAKLIPKILTLIVAVGVTALIMAEYTPLFDIIGRPMVPVLTLLRVPNAVDIAPSTLIGITEMYLPVLLIADKGVETAAAYFITVLTLVQIIFFAETAVVIMISGIPVTVKELVIIFLERTLIAMPIIAIFMHILF